MIQVIGLRPYFDKKKNQESKKHVLFGQCVDVPTLFENIDAVLATIPKEEHWNLYWTAMDCEDPGKRKFLRRFKSQKVIQFDIDGIDVAKIDAYIPIILAELGVKQSVTGIVATGNGLQFIIEIKKPFTEGKYYNESKHHYKSICDRIDAAFKKEGLPGNADTAVWSASRILRLPGTENRKPPPKGTKKATLIQGVIKPQAFSLEKCSGLPELQDEQTVKDWNPRTALAVDKDAILKDCEFIKWCFEHPELVREPHFYAAISILGRMEDGGGMVHKLAEAIQATGSDSTVAGYSHSEIESKLEQALETSGPRTQKGINDVWGKCKDCPMRSKCTSPINLKGEDFIATKDTGFHRPVKKGNQIKMEPEYRDLIKHYDNLYHHKTNMGGIVFVYENNHYRTMERPEIKNFAEKSFNPKDHPHLPFATDRVCKEFLHMVERNELVKQDFFVVRGRLNFANGVLDLKTLELSDHSSVHGFQYILDYDYAPEAICPEFDVFLDQITCGDTELQNTLLEFMGYALSGDSCWAQKCLLMTGEGANGKSTFIQLMEELAGHHNVSALPLKSMDKATSISLLEDKLFNVSEETPQGKYIEGSQVKNLITGGRVEARKLYKDAYFMVNKAKFIFACNELPQVKDTTAGWFRRFIIMPFNATFEETYDPENKKFIANKQITKKLVLERSGIMNRVVKAYQSLVKRQRFESPKATTDILGTYRIENDPIRYWLEESGRVEVSPLNGRSHFSTIKELYSSYVLSMEFEAREYPMSVSKFSRRLLKTVTDGEQRRGYKKIDEKSHRVLWDVKVNDDM